MESNIKTLLSGISTWSNQKLAEKQDKVLPGSGITIAEDGKTLSIDDSYILPESTISNVLKTNLKFLMSGNTLSLLFNGEIIDSVVIPISGGSIGCTGITVNTEVVNVLKNSSEQIIITVKPVNCTETLYVTSDDETIASVSNDGTVTWVSGGETTITINCGTKEVTVAVNCDELLSTIYSYANKKINTGDGENIEASDDKISLSFSGYTKNTWSLSGEEVESDEVVAEISVGLNKTNSQRQVSGSYSWNNQTIPYSVNQTYLTMPKYLVGWYYSDATNMMLEEKAEGTEFKRRTFAKLRDNTSETQFMFPNMNLDLHKTYDLIYIPASANTVTIEWNSPLRNWYYAANILKKNGERVYDSGWNYKDGIITFDSSSYDCGLYLAGNFKSSPETAESCQNATFWTLNPKITFDTDTVWSVISSNILTQHNTKNMGGIDSYENSFYQFYNENGGVLKYNLLDLSESPEEILTPDSLLSYNSVCFSNILEYGSTTITTPLVFATGQYEVSNIEREIVDVIDLENNLIVKQYYFPNRQDEIVAAWDFDNNKCWIIGYEHENGYTDGCDWYIDEYSIDDFSDQNNNERTIIKSYYIKGADGYKVKDCVYKNGYLYILAGGDSVSKYGAIFKFDTENRILYGKTLSSSMCDFSGIAFYGNDLIITNKNGELYQVLCEFENINTSSTIYIDIKPESLTDLYDKGCLSIFDVYAEHPEIMNTINGSNGLLFDGKSTFNTGIIPSSDDNVEGRFTMTGLTGGANALWCTRNGSNNSFSTFLISNSTSVNVRSDFGSSVGQTSNFGPVALNQYHVYSQKNGLLSLDGTQKTISTVEFSALYPMIIGASFTTYPTGDVPIACSNYMSSTIVHAVSIIGNNNKYKQYLVPISDNMMVDLVTGNSFPNKQTKNGSGTLITGDAKFIAMS